MDMDDTIRIFTRYCLLPFAVTMMLLGHVMSGNGNDGLDAMNAQAACKKNPQVFNGEKRYVHGVDIGDDKHFTCGR